MVNLEWYRTFVAIYQQGNLTRAAEELFISQSSASVQLSALESHIGKKLFERKPRTLIPTEFGKRLYTQVINAIDDLEKVEDNFQSSYLKDYLLLRIGSPVEFFHNNVLDLLQNSEADFEIKLGLTDELVELLYKEELDFVFATRPAKNNDLVYEKIKMERFQIVVSKDFDTSEFDQLIAEDKYGAAEAWLLKQKWIVYDNKLSLIRRFWRHNFNKRPLIKPHIVVGNINSISKAVSLGLGISVVSDLAGITYFEKGLIKTLWKGRIPSLNTLFLAYKKDYVNEELLGEMKRILRLK